MGKLIGEGTLLQVGNGAGPPEVFTTIGQRVTIGGPNLQVEAVDQTDLDDAVVTSRPGQIPDMGELSLSIFFDPANTGHQQLETDCLTPGPTTIRSYRLVFNNNTSSRPHREFKAFPTAFATNGMERNGNLGADVTLKVNTKPVSGNTTIS